MGKNHKHSAEFRFYEELNVFLPHHLKKQTFTYPFSGKPTVKDAIEGLGIPHTEVDLIIVNGQSVTFHYHLRPNDRVAVYPIFESLDISNINRLRREPLRNTQFVLDVHLGKLTRYLRFCGFNSFYRNDLEDPEIIEISLTQKRVILTRDLGILKTGCVTHGYFVRSDNPRKQLSEVINRFDLSDQLNPFNICPVCNGPIAQVEKRLIVDSLPPKTKQFFNEFYQCQECEQIYWKGSHYESIRKNLNGMLAGIDVDKINKN